MGAEEHGKGTSSLVAMGYQVRQCQSNTCPVVFAARLFFKRKIYQTPEKVVTVIKFVATEVEKSLLH